MVSHIGQTQYLEIDQDQYQLIDREIISNDSQRFYTVKPVLSKNMSADFTDEFISEALDFLKDDLSSISSETAQSSKPILRYLYHTKADLYAVNEENFRLGVRPIFFFSSGRRLSNTDRRLFQNSRGVRLYGVVDDRIGFQTQFTENQAVFPEYVNVYSRNPRSNIVPHQGFWKRFGEHGVDFIRATGHITFPVSKSIQLQLGHDRHFVGDGIRSLFLSDFGNSYPFLKVSTQVWRFKYTNLYAQLTAGVRGDANGTYGTSRFSTKFMSMHHLSLDVSERLNVGFFENIISYRGDSTGSDGFDLTYLNPVIFYRAIEQDTGSPDNAVLGFDFNCRIGKRSFVYGQFLVDEMKIGSLFDGSGWWGNKFGVQMGTKFLDLLTVDNLDLTIEGNLVRPYTYSHDTIFTNYSHYNQVLAHPLGANFLEQMIELRYRPIFKWLIVSRFTQVHQGIGDNDENFGHDIFNSYSDIGQERAYGNEFLQGNRSELLVFDNRLSYMIRHNLFIDLQALLRIDDVETTRYVNLSLRLNSPFLNYTF